MGFPQSVNVVQALAVAGDFASANPYANALTDQGGYVADAVLGCYIGLFAWADAANRTVKNAGAGQPRGFVHNARQGLITAFLADASMQIPPGLPVILMDEGDFFVKNDGAAAATIGMKVYANSTTGQASFAATGTPPTDATSTASTIAATTSTASTIIANSFTGSIAGQLMTLSAVTGLALPGYLLAGTNIANGTTILAQLTGTKGGTGTYTVSISQTAASGTITTPNASTLTVGGTVTGFYAVGEVISGTGVTVGSVILDTGTGAGIAGTYGVSNAQVVGSGAINATGGLLTVGGTLTGTFRLYDVLSGSGMTAGTYIKRLLTGTGGAGTYLVNIGQTFASGAINALSGIETKWYAGSAGAVGELIKMTTRQQ